MLWQAAGATGAFVAGLGAVGYATRRDLSSWIRVLFWALLALIVFGLVAIFVAIPHANLIYAVLGIVIFGGFTIFDFNRLRRADQASSVVIAASIFLDIFNVFLLFLRLFGGGGAPDRLSERRAQLLVVGDVVARARSVLPDPHHPIRPRVAKALRGWTPISPRTLRVAMAAAPAGTSGPGVARERRQIGDCGGRLLPGLRTGHHLDSPFELLDRQRARRGVPLEPLEQLLAV